VVDTSQKKTLLQGEADLYSQEEKYLEEIENSYTAKEMTLQTYEEMRMWYPVHHDLLCLRRQLTDYNTQLRKFIDRVVIMPRKFLNYGSKQSY